MMDHKVTIPGKGKIDVYNIEALVAVVNLNGDRSILSAAKL